MWRRWKPTPIDSQRLAKTDRNLESLEVLPGFGPRRVRMVRHEVGAQRAEREDMGPSGLGRVSPALGAADRGVGYRFLDAAAAPGVRYEYTIQAITELGLTSHSGTIASSPE